MIKEPRSISGAVGAIDDPVTPIVIISKHIRDSVIYGLGKVCIKRHCTGKKVICIDQFKETEELEGALYKLFENGANDNIMLIFDNHNPEEHKDLTFFCYTVCQEKYYNMRNSLGSLMKYVPIVILEYNDTDNHVMFPGRGTGHEFTINS